MPKVPLTATKDFTYMTRRLSAGDTFEARNALEAKVLMRVRKVAEEPKARRAAPKVEEAPAVEEPKKPARRRKARAKK